MSPAQNAEPLDLSIIIVNYNTGELLAACLESIYAQQTALSLEVLVVDNYSNDGSAQMVRERFGDVLLFANQCNLGFVRANNRAIERSRGRRLLLLNPDTVVPPGTLERLVQFLDSSSGAGIVGCKQVDGQGRIQLTWGRFPTVLSEIQRKSRHMRMSLDDSAVRTALEDNLNGTCNVDWVAGSCMLVRREVVDKIGPMDENIFMYFEDIDWCRRAREAGFRVCIDSQTQIVHFGGESAATDKITSLIEYRRSQFYFLRKYRGRLFGLLTRLWVLFKSLGYLSLWAVRYWYRGDPEERYEAECMALVYKNIAALALTGRLPAKIEH
ncbi:MAG: glycosyltransferase family 2 protein [Candidatus Alcyoniella australis]|nr:glycosyltransferase family 2 protein [Candidatus Alcyoniella australis]